MILSLILDKIHKMPGWKNYFEGIYDTKPEQMMTLVTGSARLEAFQESGDSLPGRFFRHRLLPFSPAEIGADVLGMKVDSCLTNGDMPELMVEAKRSDATPGRSILNFKDRYHIAGVQVVLHLKHEKTDKGIEIRRGLDYLKSLIFFHLS